MTDPRERASRQLSVTADFERETKLVVLNFMGIVPVSCPQTADVCETARVDEDDLPQRIIRALPDGIGDLEPSEEDSSVVQNGALGGQQYNELSGNRGIDTVPVVLDTCIEDDEDGHSGEATSSKKLNLDAHVQSSSRHTLQPSENTAFQLQSMLLPVPETCARSPSPSDVAGLAVLERRLSSQSANSSRSRASSTRNSCVNVQLANLDALVKMHTLPPLVIPLRDEISHEMEVLGQEHHDGDEDDGVLCLNFCYIEILMSSHGSVVKAPSKLGFNSAGTHVSRWWWQEGHL